MIDKAYYIELFLYQKKKQLLAVAIFQDKTNENAKNLLLAYFLFSAK